LTATMMNESTKKLSIEDISNELAKLGASYSWSSGDAYTILNIRSLSKNADKAIKLAINSLLEPKFDESDFLRNKNNVIQNLKQSKKQPSRTASEVFNKLLYGTNNSFAYSSSGTEKTVPGITLDDVVDFYTANYSPKIASIVAVSDLGKTELVKLLAPLNQWAGGDVLTPAIKPFPVINGQTVYFLDQPGAPQSEIRIGQRALAYDAKGEYFKAGIMNYMLGGAFNSRINLNLREDKGYTYGARSFFNGNELYGYYRAGAGVRADSTADSLNEFMKEMNEYRNNGITDNELKFTKSAIGQSDARAYETPSQKLGFLSRMMTYDLDPSFVDEQANILKKIDVAEINDLAKKYLNTDEMVTVIVGDKKKYMSEIKGLGYSVIEIDADGAAIDINNTN
ncbi:MAG: pitrilysin family protein, partial [Hellea sp.]|nr:pitrilysin family protein [Hellea sp.]